MLLVKDTRLVNKKELVDILIKDGLYNRIESNIDLKTTMRLLMLKVL